MYMREMGSVELLTREGEIVIAKKIEEGLKDMIQAISACPTTIAEILAAADRIAADEIKIDEIVDGLVDQTRPKTRLLLQLSLLPQKNLMKMRTRKKMKRKKMRMAVQLLLPQFLLNS
jgi:patatin-like phospholipase/acyl hydrolase